MAEGGAAAPLPVHGFVLAGGKSSRMGRDKALQEVCGRSMVDIAVEKLRTCCAAVSISGNREDLHRFAPVVRETRMDAGPAAGVEAGLGAASETWALFLPVDVPLLPAELLRCWAEAVLRRAREGVRLSFLRAAGQRHPAICVLHRDCADAVRSAVDEGIYKLGRIFELVDEQLGPGSVWMADAEAYGDGFGDGSKLEQWFTNVNTPGELADAEAFARGSRTGL